MDIEFHEISTGELLLLLDKPGTKIIDVRSADAYNGWDLQSEKRGGHIKNAKSLPVKWTAYFDWIEMVRRKQLLPAHEIVVYGYTTEDSGNAAARFLESGYPNVSVYNRFLTEWTVDPALPMQRLLRFRNLVPAEWVNTLITGGQPQHYRNDKHVVVHAHYRNRGAYLSGHIPGAIDMDTLALEAPETWNRRNPDELAKALEVHGITADTTVVLYGKYMSPDNNDPFPGSAAGDIGAIRCAFIMMYAGVKDVRVLNGGFQSWLDARYEVSYAEEPKQPVPEFGATIPVHPELAVDTPEARQMIASAESELVCVRSRPEYIGEVSGYNYIEKKGRIPGAIFADCGSDAYHMENYRNFDHTTREYHEIAEIWKNSGITPGKRLAFYCGTGWRGSEAWFNAWLMGWPKISVYDGGWFEWSNDPANPVETGPGNISPVLSDDPDETAAGILNGLATGKKTISSRFFYDSVGSALFEEITRLPEYYLTRTEISILSECAPHILKNGDLTEIIEFGSGDCSKISILLDALPAESIPSMRYIPVDVSRDAIMKSTKVLSEKYPGIQIQGIHADFMNAFSVNPGGGNKLICFFGSTIGNLTEEQEFSFLNNLKEGMKPGDQLLIGFDMVKDTQILEDAYNDGQGVTAAFNKNILNVVNRYAQTGFNPDQFEHLSFFNKTDSRIEMHLKALTDCVISRPGAGNGILVKKGETIHTENSRKYTIGYIHQLAEKTGLKIVKVYTDPMHWFSLVRFDRNKSK
jgi:thiosulfate/3-mercaptopyruvate sulfurtransferase